MRKKNMKKTTTNNTNTRKNIKRSKTKTGNIRSRKNSTTKNPKDNQNLLKSHKKKDPSLTSIKTLVGTMAPSIEACEICQSIKATRYALYEKIINHSSDNFMKIHFNQTSNNLQASIIIKVFVS